MEGCCGLLRLSLCRFSLSIEDAARCFCLRADRIVHLPAIVRAIRASRLVPQPCPFFRVVQFAFRIRAASCGEPRKRPAPGGLANGIVSEVEVPADVVAIVGKRRMAAQTVELKILISRGIPDAASWTR